MMELAIVQAVENHAEIEGRVLKIQDDESRPGHQRATIAVTAVTPVESYPNLLGEVVGQTIDVVIRAEASRLLKPGDLLRCRARRTSPTTVFADNCTSQ